MILDNTLYHDAYGCEYGMGYVKSERGGKKPLTFYVVNFL